MITERVEEIKKLQNSRNIKKKEQRKIEENNSIWDKKGRKSEGKQGKI